MKGADTIALIRREFFVRGKTIKQIAREIHKRAGLHLPEEDPPLSGWRGAGAAQGRHGAQQYTAIGAPAHAGGSKGEYRASMLR